MIDRIEVGKKYRLIDKESYLNSEYCGSFNAIILEQGYFDPDGCVVIDEVDSDGEGWADGENVISPFEYQFFELVEETEMESKESKAVTPDTEVTITTTYGELARAYYVLGMVNGKGQRISLWSAIGDALGDLDRSIYRENTSRHERPTINYVPVQEKWESLFFKTKEQLEKELAIKEKRDLIAKLQKEIEELGGAR